MDGSHTESGNLLSFTVELETVDDLLANVEMQQRFLADLDRLAVAHITLRSAPSIDGIGELARFLADAVQPVDAATGRRERPVVGDFSAPAKLDDGRPRARTFIENLHFDLSSSGWSSYGILHTREVPATEPMVWVDMRAVYRSLPDALRRQVQQLRGLQQRRPSTDEPRPAALEIPLVAAHPRTHEPLLLLPDRVRGSIVGLERDASNALLGELWRRVDESAARYARELRSGDLYVWDNFSTAHTNPVYPRGFARSIWFLNAGCVEAIAPAATTAS